MTLPLASWNKREILELFGFENYAYSGIYTDFNKGWFNDVAPFIVANMFWFAIWPIIEFSYNFGIRHFFRF
jgi:hypothetical protein